MLIQERIQLILKMHTLTPSAFADKIGVQRSNVSHVLSGRNKPSLDFLTKIVASFPRVNAHWLLTGDMPKLDPSKNPGVVKDEGPIVYGEKTVERKKILKIVTFYEDDSFDVAYPNEG